ncbi:MAG TPA: hypothetical protein VK474_13880, partial [Chthoniobacterales bacterium]|nr:hypothetical protein [Chthoniobacterales bacterium]
MKLRFYSALASSLLLGALPSVWAQVGNNNPTGPAGTFNGNITTGCSYDPYTGNAMRALTDLTVSGTVGSYPLAFGRTSNSRSPSSGQYGFGGAGGWRHSYAWSLTSGEFSYTNSNFAPTSYPVAFPDGRVITFIRSTLNPEFQGPKGVRERFVPLNGNLLAYLLLPDGGRVEFKATRQSVCEIIPDVLNPLCRYSYTYRAQAIIDPHGLRTVLAYNGDGSLNTITEPGGHWLQLLYATTSWSHTNGIHDRVIQQVKASDGRFVKYNYGFNHFAPATALFTYLANAVYFNNSSLTATYNYQVPNVGSINGPPLLSSCRDIVYAGPMRDILYTYATGPNLDQTAAVFGQLRYERAYSGQAVSALDVAVQGRVETRGDGPFRLFMNPANNGQISTWSDFNNLRFSSRSYNSSGFLQSVKDGNGHTTNVVSDLTNGSVTSVQYPSTSSDASNGRGTVLTAYSPGVPYYVTGTTDENNKTTTYTLDAFHRVADVSYPDAAHEGFVYNTLGQVTRHQRKNGKFEHFEYNTRHLLVHAWNPVAGSTQPTGSEPRTTIIYWGGAWLDRVRTVTDPRGNNTTYEYERDTAGSPIPGRGLVSKIIFPDGKYRTFVYDIYGNITREENELRQPTEYSYDDYSRLTEVKVARPDPNNLAVQLPGQWNITKYDYTPSFNVSPYARTGPLVTTSTSPASVIVNNVYDENLRLREQTRQNPGGVSATTKFSYDYAGNQTLITDPRGKITTIAYDQRNRRTKATSPEVYVAGVTAKAPLVTEWFYDPAGNVRRVIQPDTTVASPRDLVNTYNPMNRVLTSTDPMGRQTAYTYFPSGKLKSVQDPEQRMTKFEYDERDLQSKLIYPNNAAITGWKYDENGNLTTRPTVGDRKQLFTYDTRNRPLTMRWDNAIDFSDFAYDAAGRLISANNPFSTITRQYDIAGRLILDRQKFPAVANPPPAPVQPLTVISGPASGVPAAFAIDLPLFDTPGVECRSGGDSGDYTLTLTFADPVTFQKVSVTSGTGEIVNPQPTSGTTITLNLTGVSDAQRLIVTFTELSDGTNSGDLLVPMQVLMGDVDGTGTVDPSDIAEVSAAVGQAVTPENFRNDVDGSGGIDDTDVKMVQAAAGTETASTGPLNQTANVCYRCDADGRMNRLFVANAANVITDYNFAYGYDGMGRLATIQFYGIAGTTY